MKRVIMAVVALLVVASGLAIYTAVKMCIRDSSELKANTYLAEHDPLTDLPNRALFLRRAEAALVASQRSGQPTAIAIVDLDRFKEVNDTLGHHNGDHLLTELAGRLATFLSLIHI